MNFRNILNNIIITFGTEVGIKIFSLFSTILLVRNLSTNDFGTFSLLMSFALTLCYLTCFGLPQAIVFHVGKYRKMLKKIVSASFFLNIFVAITVVTIFYLFRDYPLNSFLKKLPEDYFLMLLVLYFVNMLNLFIISLFRATKKFFLFNLSRALPPIFCLIGLIYLYLAANFNLNNSIVVFMSVNIVFVLGFFVKIISILPIQFSFDVSIVKTMSKYGLKSYLALIVVHLIYQIDLYIIACLLGVSQVAFYTISAGVATLLWLLPNIIGWVIFPEFASTSDEQEIHLFSAKICRQTIFIMVIAAFSLALVGRHLIILLYGAEYIKSVNAMILILPGIISMSSYKILTRNFSSRNRQQFPIIAASIALIVNICLNFLWIPGYGIEGAALASTISYVLATAILMVMFKRESNISFLKIMLIDGTDIKIFGKIISKFYIKSIALWNQKK